MQTQLGEDKIYKNVMLPLDSSLLLCHGEVESDLKDASVEVKDVKVLRKQWGTLSLRNVSARADFLFSEPVYWDFLCVQSKVLELKPLLA